MRKTFGPWLAMAALVYTIDVGAAPTALRDTSVNLWFGSAVGDGLRSDGLTSVANGVTADYIDGIQNVLAIMQSTGNFRFDTQNSTRTAASRAMCLDFGTQYPGPLPFGNGSSNQCVNVLQAMHNYATGDVAIQNLRYGQAVQKLVRFTWMEAGYAYRLGYGSDMDLNGVIDSPPVRVSCIAPQDPAAACQTWLLTPSQAPGTAAFFRFPLLKNGEGPAEFLGSYGMPFSQTFTRK